MDSRNLEKALDIYAKLTMGEEVRRSHPVNGKLYEEYYQNAEVYEILGMIMKKLNLHIYEYQDALFLTAGEGNRVFGYTNDELKRVMGLRYNKELYLVYYIMYQILLAFYQDSASYQFKEYVKLEDVIREVTKSLTGIMKDIQIMALNEVEENSFKSVAVTWDALPVATTEDQEQARASRASQMGIVKLTFNFLISQGLFLDMEERYYPTNRMKALVENYFEEYRGQIYEVLGRRETDAEY